MNRISNISFLSLFSFTLLISAGLIFWVEPLVAKMLLPYFGGAPAVWNTAMMFFQGTLLLGYLYAHFIAKLPQRRLQLLVHLILLILALSFLPFAIAKGWRANDLEPITSLLTQLGLMVGLPLIILSANAPLLQRWFSYSKHPQAHDPYFLYGASNLGSMLGLICFPFVLEPSFTLTQQSSLWFSGFMLLIFLVLLCSIVLWKVSKDRITPAKVQPASSEKIPATQIIRWILLAFAPSSLLLGVTTHLTTDVAAIPLFWVVPLALYLLTFIIVFARKPFLSHSFNLKLQFITVIPFFFVISMSFLLDNIWVNFAINLLAFFFAALVCHGELVRSRPHTRQLTQFYLWIAFGGLLGGVFNAIVAPQIFTLVLEYPIAMAIALMLRPQNTKDINIWDFILPIIAGFAVFILSLYLDSAALKNISFTFALIFGLISLVFLSFPERSIRLGLGLGVLMLTSIFFLNPYQTHLLVIKRNFFGTIRVAHDKRDQVHILLHGTTVHGIQFTKPSMQKTIRAYYTPLNDVIKAVDKHFSKTKVAIAGLGSGTLACYARPQDQFTFYEIDSDMIKIAENTKYFTYLKLCPAKGGIILGDARLKLEKAKPHFYNLIILDAFSSDAIPVHLITAEAIKLYLDKLSPTGLLVFNITNRNLNLIPVLTGLANHFHLASLLRIDNQYEWNKYKFGSRWVVLARSKKDFGSLNSNSNWKPLPKHTSERLWTDNYSDIWDVLMK